MNWNRKIVVVAGVVLLLITLAAVGCLMRHYAEHRIGQNNADEYGMCMIISVTPVIIFEMSLATWLLIKGLRREKEKSVPKQNLYRLARGHSEPNQPVVTNKNPKK